MGRRWRHRDDGGGAGRLELVTVTNDANRARRLLQTAPLPVRVLGPLGNATFSDFLRDVYLLLHVRDLVRRGFNNTVVILLDAWDTVYLGCGRSLLSSFRALRRPLFFSAELGSYPYGAAAVEMSGALHSHRYARLPRCARPPRDSRRPCRPRAQRSWGRCAFCLPPAAGGGYRFLNTGCFGGYAWALDRALTRLYDSGAWRTYAVEHPLHAAATAVEGKGWTPGSPHGWPDTQQGVWQAYWLAHPNEIALDYGASICLSLHGMRPEAAFQLRDGGRVVAPAFAKDVCFAHANGATDVAPLDVLVQAAQATRFGRAAAARLRKGQHFFSVGSKADTKKGKIIWLRHTLVRAVDRRPCTPIPGGSNGRKRNRPVA